MYIQHTYVFLDETCAAVAQDAASEKYMLTGVETMKENKVDYRRRPNRFCQICIILWGMSHIILFAILIEKIVITSDYLTKSE